MQKNIIDGYTGLEYELVGNYYLLSGDDETVSEPLGIWGLRHRRFLREHKGDIYSGMLLTGKLDGYLHQIDKQAEEMFAGLVKQLAEKEGITEQLKVEDQIAWIGAMNNIYVRASEVIDRELIYV